MREFLLLVAAAVLAALIGFVSGGLVSKAHAVAGTITTYAAMLVAFVLLRALFGV